MLNEATTARERLEDVAYHFQREAQERAAAAETVDAAARLIHLDLAERHADRARCVGGVASPLIGRDTDATLSSAKPRHEMSGNPTL